MRNAWLVIRREYLERVRSRAFIVFTVLMPALVFALAVLPSKLMSLKYGKTRHIVLVATNTGLAEAVKRELATAKASEPSDDDRPERLSYSVDINGKPTDETRKQLTAEVSAGTLDGYLWLSDEAIAERKFKYTTRNSSDFVENTNIREAVTDAIALQEFSKHGISAEEGEQLLRSARMETVGIEKGKEKRAAGMAVFFVPFLLMMMIYLSVIIYGVSVMRSVLEEKTTRIVELLLSSLTARELMLGKILGVGAVGLTQILIWSLMGGLASAPTIIAARPYLSSMQLPVAVYIFFPVLFVLGYLLYSTIYATVASIVDSEEESQQFQMPIMLPLILCTIFAMSVIRQPDSSLAFWTSMFPLTSPIIMFVRIIVQQPPAWQIALCLALLIGTVYALILLCARIYRVGILMHGKRPTLPEILKWIKYAG